MLINANITCYKESHKDEKANDVETDRSTKLTMVHGYRHKSIKAYT